MFDHDHSGSVTHTEFRESLRNLGFHMNDEEFHKFVLEYDRNNTGSVNYMQFNNKVGEIIHPRETGTLMFGSGPTSATLASWVEAKFARAIMRDARDPEEAFDKLDTDNSGALSAAEFVQAVREFGLKLSYEEGADLVSKYDPAGLGKITREMFKKRIIYMMNQSSSALCPPGCGVTSWLCGAVPCCNLPAHATSFRFSPSVVCLVVCSVLCAAYGCVLLSASRS